MIDGEKNIIEKAIMGEASAFGLLYDRYQPQIYRFIYLKVGHREEAEDLTHQVFLKSWNSIDNYTFQNLPFSSWLYRIARNQVIDYYRTKKDVLSIEIEEIVELRMESPAVYIDNNIDAAKLREAIIKLNLEQQDVIVLRFIEDFSIKETASAMDKTEMAVKLLQHRAIKNLKKILDITNV
jgi:RNA polymerase sigma-70 factor (ECF subfamily)